MKVLSASLGNGVKGALIERGVIVEDMEGDDSESLELFLKCEEYDASVINLVACQIRAEDIRSIRRHGIATPVVGLWGLLESSGNRWSNTRAEFLESGGDDFLPSTVGSRELYASLLAVSRRRMGILSDRAQFFMNDLTLEVDFARFTVSLNGREVDLTNKELQLLFILASRPSKWCTREYILDQLYVFNNNGRCHDINLIQAFVSKIRRKFNAIESQSGDIIQTIHGKGYRLPSQAPAKFA